MFNNTSGRAEFGATAFGMHSGSNFNSVLSENAMISDKLRTRKLTREKQFAEMGT